MSRKPHPEPNPLNLYQDLYHIGQQIPSSFVLITVLFCPRFSDECNPPVAGRCSPFWKNLAPVPPREHRGTPTSIQSTDLTKYQTTLVPISSSAPTTKMAFFSATISSLRISPTSVPLPSVTAHLAEPLSRATYT